MLVRQNEDTPFPVVLTDETGAPVPGAGPASFQGGVATVVKADRTVVDFTLTAFNFFEIDAVKARGLYHVIVPGSALNLRGPVQLCLRPAGAASFLADIVTGDVEVPGDLAGLPASVSAAVWDASRAAHFTPATMGDVMRVLFQVLAGRVKIDATAGTLAVYQEDGGTILQVQALTKAGGAVAGLDAVERSVATRPPGEGGG